MISQAGSNEDEGVNIELMRFYYLIAVLRLDKEWSIRQRRRAHEKYRIIYNEPRFATSSPIHRINCHLLCSEFAIDPKLPQGICSYKFNKVKLLRMHGECLLQDIMTIINGGKMSDAAMTARRGIRVQHGGVF